MDELAAAQQRLGRALDRARAGEDRQLAQQVRERGEQVANLFGGLLRMTRVHAPDNKAFDQPVAELRTALVALLDLLGTIHLVAVGDQTYVNEVRVRSPKGKTDLGTELGAHNIGGLTFHAAPEEAGLRRLLGLLGGKPAPTDRRGAIERALKESGADGVELTPVYRFRLGGEEEPDRAPRRPLDVAAEALQRLSETWDNLVAGRQPNVLPLRRVVAELCKVGVGAEELWGPLPDAPAHVQHAFRVCQLVLVTGQAAGLAEGILQDLGVAGLLHDAGYAHRVGGAAPGFAAHPGAGARVLLRQLGFHEAKVRRALAALEHHRDARDEQRRPTLFARAIRIAEDYDNLCRRGGGGLSPTMALCTMVPGAGTRYDPVLFQLLANRLGYYPPGTHLVLADGRLVRAVSLVRGPETFQTPRAVVVREANGAAPAQPLTVDLAEGGQVAKVARAP